MYRWLNFICIVLILLLNEGLTIHAQISPGKLSKAHSKLEGMSNCTQCHVLGSKVANEKCLTCHTEIKDRINAGKGYHVSAEVKEKTCAQCHNEHHGEGFQLIHFDQAKFEHQLTGYILEGAHRLKACKDCHQAARIADPKIRQRTGTYLGLKTNCSACHEDYHQQTLSGSCSSCHNQEAFRPAGKFNHSTARYRLSGQHIQVDCIKCHRKETRNGKPFQVFTGLKFQSCVNCHTDVHQNKFGQNCRQCHSEESFHVIKGTGNFNHANTSFPLEGKHVGVSCKSCHKGKLTDPLAHDRCTSCHHDFHKGQFIKNGEITDCSACHSPQGFSPASFTLEQHNQGAFILRGAHLATACLDCHFKKDNWNFRGIGSTCADCHNDIHQGLISEKYYPGKSCSGCHQEPAWNRITFDHSATSFPLRGAHMNATCRDCHFGKESAGHSKQIFSGLSLQCSACHQDHHYRQFEVNGNTDCSRCHESVNWKASLFNHNTTAFILEGKHLEIACSSCHKKVKRGDAEFIEYQIKDFRCEACH
ncbi:MAG: cytochrome C [Bacteroidales bacterium]